MFFKMVQDNWIQKVRKNHKYLEISKDDEFNLNRGGNCGIFELLEELRHAFKDNKEILERITTSIKPDILLKRETTSRTLDLRYSVLKITTKLSKQGKNPQWLFL